MKSTFSILCILSLLIGFSASCSDPIPAPRTDSNARLVERLSDSPVLSTEVNCADKEKGDQGHSAGPGMNHCGPTTEAKEKAREPYQMSDR